MQVAILADNTSNLYQVLSVLETLKLFCLVEIVSKCSPRVVIIILTSDKLFQIALELLYFQL